MQIKKNFALLYGFFKEYTLFFWQGHRCFYLQAPRFDLFTRLFIANEYFSYSLTTNNIGIPRFKFTRLLNISSHFFFFLENIQRKKAVQLAAVCNNIVIPLIIFNLPCCITTLEFDVLLNVKVMKINGIKYFLQLLLFSMILREIYITEVIFPFCQITAALLPGFEFFIKTKIEHRRTSASVEGQKFHPV